MNEQTPSLEEQEELLERLTWETDDLILYVEDYNPFYISRDFRIFERDKRRTFQFLRPEALTADKVNQMVSGSPAISFRAKVLKSFLSTDGVLFKPTSK